MKHLTHLPRTEQITASMIRANRRFSTDCTAPREGLIWVETWVTALNSALKGKEEIMQSAVASLQALGILQAVASRRSALTSESWGWSPRGSQKILSNSCRVLDQPCGGTKQQRGVGPGLFRPTAVIRVRSGLNQTTALSRCCAEADLCQIEIQLPQPTRS